MAANLHTQASLLKARGANRIKIPRLTRLGTKIAAIPNLSPPLQIGRKFAVTSCELEIL